MAHCPAYGGRSARCAARWTRAATTCANPTPTRGAVELNSCCAACCRACGPAGHRAGPLPAADGGRAGAGRLVLGCCTQAQAARCWAMQRGLAARCAASSRPTARCCWWAVIGWWLVLAQQEPPRGAGRVQPPDRAAGAGDRQHRRTDEELQRPSRRPSRPTRPRAATSRPSATSCARR
jgi:hypothetical protein